MLIQSCANRLTYIKSAGAELPVMIKGNEESHQYIIVIAGGPAGDGIMYHYVFPLFKKLEKDYRLVYYDQRGSGNAKGSPEISSFNLNQHANDLSKLIDFILEGDSQAEINLIGYSYGGTIAMTFLKDNSHKANAAITISGAFDRKLQAQYQRQITVELLNQWIDEDYIDTYDYITSEFTCPPNDMICKQDSASTHKKINKRLKSIEKLNRYPVNISTLGNLLSYGLFAPGSPLRSARNEKDNAKYFQPEFDSLMLSNHVENVETPVLLVNGKYDTNVPYYDAQKMHDSLKGNSPNSELLILKHSGHVPMFTEPDVLYEKIRMFWRRNR